MKYLIFCLFLGLKVSASGVPAMPPNACYEGCNSYMSDLLTEFEEVGSSINLKPAVYSGICHHLGIYNADTEHHAVVLIDQVNGRAQFSTIFAFFAGQNDFADWTVVQARNEMSNYWKDHGVLVEEQNTSRVVISDDDGNPAYIYWMRQNPQTKDLLYITYAGTAMKSFCRLTPKLILSYGPILRS